MCASGFHHSRSVLHLTVLHRPLPRRLSLLLLVLKKGGMNGPICVYFQISPCSWTCLYLSSTAERATCSSTMSCAAMTRSLTLSVTELTPWWPVHSPLRQVHSLVTLLCCLCAQQIMRENCLRQSISDAKDASSCGDDAQTKQYEVNRQLVLLL